LRSRLGHSLKKKVDLILTSPPFPLNNKKKYGNLQGEEYKKWFASLAEIYSDLLSENGSIVIELGNAWEPGRPVQSLLNLESLLNFVNNPNAGLRLCQEFICYNPARLPSPAQWVTVNRIRTTDSYTHVWWMAKTDYPKADNRRVLRPYSKSMKNLLKRKEYNPGVRPSEHNISPESFLKDNAGSIMHNIIEIDPMDPKREVRLPENIFSISNTSSNDYFSRSCRERGMVLHPARMPPELASFFVEFLTEPGDLVLDPFAGSNTTGYCAQKLSRRWVSIEADMAYGMQSIIRFEDPTLDVKLKVKEGILGGYE
jgi:site-specific DNA-methyltransferase (cytosine-N4-specific)